MEAVPSMLTCGIGEVRSKRYDMVLLVMKILSIKQGAQVMFL